MRNDVFITAIATFFPNNPVDNESMEDYLGLISGQHSRVKNIVLRQNGIKNRYYALTAKQEVTHTNAELAANSIKSLLGKQKFPEKEIELLTCATSNADQLMPSHASMVHGLLKNKPLEIFATAGICLSCIQALKIAYWAIRTGEKKNAVCSASELPSPGLLSKNYDIEYELCSNVGTEPYMALEKDFLRFMLSDGASAVLLQNKPDNDKALKIEWIEMVSYANELPTCMFAGAEKRDDGELKGWKEFESSDYAGKSLFTVKQDIKLLGRELIRYWVNHIEDSLSKHNMALNDIDYVIPHASSMIIYKNLVSEIKDRGILFDENRWYTNLTKVGNIGSAAIFAALHDFWDTYNLVSGQKILLLVPESGRFSYGTVLLSVV
ncbi:MAG: StlD/DarB family beta-ketosynthase [Bacteroides uniformis]|jgi:3-oxoacyl-[acyl-carrier-protein] synthase-3